MTVISGFTTHLVLGSVYSFGLLSPYLMSYYRNEHKDVSLDDGFFLVPSAIFSTCLSFTFAGYLDKKYGTRL